MGLQYIDRIVYDSLGHTGNTYYNRFVRKFDAKVWDSVNGVMATDPNWEDAANVLPEVGTNGQFNVVIPADMPRGTFDVLVYKQLGSAPANTDDLELQYDTSVGSIFGF